MTTSLVFNKKIRTRLLTQFIVSLTIVVLLIGAFLHYSSYSVVENMVYQRAEVKVKLAFELVSHWVDEDSLEIRSFANFLSFQDFPREKVDDLIEYESPRFSVNLPYVAFFDGEFISISWIPPKNYDVKSRSWFVESTRFFDDKSNTNAVYYSKPYVAASNEKYVITMTAPIKKNNAIIGFTALDVNVGELEHRMSSIDDVMGNWCVISDEGDILVFGSNANFVGSNIKDLPVAKAYQDIVDKNKSLGKIGVLKTVKDTFFFVKDPITKWIIAYKVNDDLISSQVALLNYGLLGSAVLLLIAFSIIIWIVSSKFTKPIVLLAKEAKKIAHGSFDCNIKTNLRDELGYLTHQFNFMAKGLKEREDYERHRARIDSELQAARSIQFSILPKALLNSKYYSTYAFYSSAREVGGDFYDYFEISDSCVVFCIGDVSGKGVPAALFMTMVCTLVRAICPVEPDPAKTLLRLNNTISGHNSECMFATVFLVYYNPLTGECRYANAGHNPVYIISSIGLKRSERVKGMLIGGFTGVDYGAGVFSLEHGDSIVMYTDGVTEAHSDNNEIFSEKRLEKVLDSCSLKTPDEIGEEIIKTVNGFQRGEQFDDISLLIWKRD